MRTTLLLLFIALGLTLGLQFAPAWAFTTDQQEDICATTAVIFCDNFENRPLGFANATLRGVQFKNGGWGVGNDAADTTQSVVNTQAFDGSKSMEARLPANDGASWIDGLFGARTDLYFRAYFKNSSNWVWSGNGNKMEFIGGPIHNHNLMFDQAVFGGDTPAFIGQQGGSATTFRYPNLNGTFHWPLNQWVCVETHVKMNSSTGSFDGSFEGWFNGTQYYSYVNQLNLDASETVINTFSVSSYWNCTNNINVTSPCDGSFPANQHPVMFRYVDNIVVSTQRIGCLGTPTSDTTPPVAPTGVTIH